MPRDLVSVKRELEETVTRLSRTSASPIERYYQYEEMASAINDALAHTEFVTSEEIQILELYLLKLCEIKAMELDVVLDFEG